MNEFIETLVQDQERAVKEERRVKKSGAVGDGEMVEVRKRERVLGLLGYQKHNKNNVAARLVIMTRRLL